MIIDFHTHVFPPGFRDDRSALFAGEPAFQTLYDSPGSTLTGVRDLIRNMDEEGVDKSVIFGFPWEDEVRFKKHNDYIIESVQRHPDRLIGFCCFSIRSPHGLREAERCLDAGLAGVGELAVYGSGLTLAVTRTLKNVMSLCLERDVPVLLHVNEPVGHQYPGKSPIRLHQIYRLLKTYSSNRIVLAHWGGGLFFYALMKKEVRDVLSHTWFDTAASPYLYRPAVYSIAGNVVGFDKILFGSDYPLLRPKRYIQEMTAAGLDSHCIDQILGANAARLLGLSA